jgi:hypothetical protein
MAERSWREIAEAFQQETIQALEKLAAVASQRDELLEVLEDIAVNASGAYSRDPVKYRDNVIADIQEKARAAIAKAKA